MVSVRCFPMVVRGLVLACAGLALTARASAGSTPRPTLAQLAWLAGTWDFERNGRIVTEQWMAPAGGTMLGMSRTISGGRAIAHEFVLLREDANGDIFYDAHPSGQEPTTFKLVRWSENEVVFENPEHDFPQRVIYRLSEAGKLDAAIEGTKNGKTMRSEFPYRRVTTAMN